MILLGVIAGGSSSRMIPLSNATMTFDYVPARDGLSLVQGGPTQAGYNADALAHTDRKWIPRFIDGDLNLQIAKGKLTNDDTFEADPGYAWTNGYSPFFINAQGDLVIRAQKVASVNPAFGAGEVPNSPLNSQPYVWMTGTLTTNGTFKQHGGYFEVECKVNNSHAVWPAFWALTDPSYPLRAEVDILEIVGDTMGNNAYHTNNLDSTSQDEGNINTGFDLSQGFHKYGALITSTQIIYYFDRVPVRTTDISSRPKFNDAYFMLLTNPIGSNLSNWVGNANTSTNNPADFVVRTVRVWQGEGPVALDLSTLAYLDNLNVDDTVATVTAEVFGPVTNINFALMIDVDTMFYLDNANKTISGNKVTIPLKLASVLPADVDALHEIRLRAVDTVNRSYERNFNITAITAVPVGTNLITNQDLTNAYWTKTNVTTPATNQITETTTNAQHNATLINKTRVAGILDYRISADVESVGGRNIVLIQCFSGNFGSHMVQGFFNLTTKTCVFSSVAGSWINLVPFVVELPANKLRIGLDFRTEASSTNFSLILALQPDQNTNSYAGSTSMGMKFNNIWLFTPVGGTLLDENGIALTDENGVFLTD